MDSKLLKFDLIKMLLETEDSKILEQVRKILSPTKKLRDDEIVGSEADGTPISRKQLLKSIEEAEEDISKGNVISHEDLVKMSKDW